MVLSTTIIVGVICAALGVGGTLGAQALKPDNTAADVAVAMAAAAEASAAPALAEAEVDGAALEVSDTCGYSEAVCVLLELCPMTGASKAETAAPCALAVTHWRKLDAVEVCSDWQALGFDKHSECITLFGQ